MTKAAVAYAIDFAKFVEAYYNGQQLPRFRIRVDGQEEVYYDEDEYNKRLEELKDRIDAQQEQSDHRRLNFLHHAVTLDQRQRDRQHRGACCPDSGPMPKVWIIGCSDVKHLIDNLPQDQRQKRQ